MYYTVVLHNFPGLSDGEKLAAETRFRSELEDALRSTSQVLAAIQAWGAVTADITTVDADTRELAIRFFQASLRARRRALRRVTDPQSAYFEILVGKQTAED